MLKQIFVLLTFLGLGIFLVPHFTVPEVSKENKKNCSGHGSYYSGRKCVCEEDYSGDYCGTKDDIAKCNVSEPPNHKTIWCVHGECTDGECNCTEGYHTPFAQKLAGVQKQCNKTCSPDCGEGGACIAGICKCHVGYYKNNTCTACPKGTIGIKGKIGCTACAAGRYMNSAAKSICDKCSAGKFQNNTGGSVCKSCVDSYSKEGQKVCKNCPAGYRTNSTVCVSEVKTCTTGHYIHGINCKSCPGGYYSPSVTYACTGCAVGHYQEGSGATICKECPVDWVAAENADECTQCPGGTYTNNETGWGNCITTPTQAPTPQPTQAPTPAPTQAPTPAPTHDPTLHPTHEPTQAPTHDPTPQPTHAPTPCACVKCESNLNAPPVSEEQCTSACGCEWLWDDAPTYAMICQPWNETMNDEMVAACLEA
jgi:hypothetical protein